MSQAGISFIDIKNLYNVDEPQTFNIQVRADSAAQANALIGKQVQVQTTIGTFANNSVITTKTITANNISNNIITIPVTLTSNVAGGATLQAIMLNTFSSDGSLKYQATTDTRFRATTPEKMLLQAVKSVITPGGSTEIVATVKNENDVPVEGETVVFSRTADASAGRLSAATAVTDSSGEARVVYQANTSSPIGGVVINAQLLNDNYGIGTKTTNITVSEEAVYTTLSFANKISSDDIYYTARASISVMDGSGRAVPNKEVSIKSYAVEYAQGRACLLDSSVTYQGPQTLNNSGILVTPNPVTTTEKAPILLESNWITSEDNPEYNYILDNDDDVNNNGALDTINPVAIIGGTVSDDGYSFVTDDKGRADFQIRYPLRYSNWVKVRFEASTLLNGSENTQSVNYTLPYLADDFRVEQSTLFTPWLGASSPFGTGGATCVDRMSVTIDRLENETTVSLTPYQPTYSIFINGESSSNNPQQGFDSFILKFDKAYALGSLISISNNGSGFSRVLNL